MSRYEAELRSLLVPRRSFEPYSARNASNQTTFLTEYCPDPYSSSFLRPVSSSRLRRPAILVYAGVVVDWLVLECQLAFRAACRTDRAGRCAARYAP